MKDTLPPERRHHEDRRSTQRGGRRKGDREGFAPLVVLVVDDERRAEHLQGLLLAFRFAVAPARSAAEALRVIPALGPDLVIADLDDVSALVSAMRDAPETRDTPIITVGRAGEGAVPMHAVADGTLPRELGGAELVDEIRRVLGTRRGRVERLGPML